MSASTSILGALTGLPSVQQQVSQTVTSAEQYATVAYAVIAVELLLILLTLVSIARKK